MKKMFFFITLSLILNCCISKEENAAINKITELSQADEITISKNFSVDNQKGKLRNLILRLKNPKYYDTTYSYRKSTSMFAWILYLNLKGKSDDYDQFKILLDFPYHKLSRDYNVNKFPLIYSYTQILKKFFTNVKFGSIDTSWSLIDTTQISKLEFMKVVTFIDTLDKEYGPKSSHNFSGFHFDTMEDNNEPVTVMWIDAEHNKNDTVYLVHYNFFVSNKTSKIVYIGINDLLKIKN